MSHKFAQRGYDQEKWYKCKKERIYEDDDADKASLVNDMVALAVELQDGTDKDSINITFGFNGHGKVDKDPMQAGKMVCKNGQLLMVKEIVNAVMTIAKKN